LLYGPDATTMHAGRTQPLSAGADRRRGFIVSGLLFTMSFATQTCWWAPRPCGGTRVLFFARAKRGIAGGTKRASRASERQRHDQDLGAQHPGQIAEGDVGGRRARAVARGSRSCGV